MKPTYTLWSKKSQEVIYLLITVAMDISEIKSLPIKDVIDRIWLEYTWWPTEFKLKEDWGITSWWTFNIAKNISKDFSKDRPNGNCFWIVKESFNLTDTETYKRFEENFWNPDMGKTKKSISQIWNWLWDLEYEQIKYLTSRFIDYELVKWSVKNYNGSIACMIYDGELPMGINCRRIGNIDKAHRFVSVPWYPTNWIYRGEIDKKDKNIYVVEWLIDFLTLKQVTSNVIGLKSADCWYRDVLRYAKEWFNIYVVKDSDESWNKIVKQLNWISFKLLNPASMDPGAKDINDLAKLLEGVDMILPIIQEHSSFVTPIDWIFDEMYWEQEIIQKQWKLWFDWPFPFYDASCSGVVPWRLYMIWAYSNTWKSKFAYYHSQRFLKYWKKVCFLTLEDWRTDVLREIVYSHDNVWMYEWKWGYRTKKENFQNLVIRDDLYHIKDIVTYIESIDSDIVFIDYVQNIQASWSMYEKNADIATALQRLATSTNKVVFALSQVSNEQKRTWQEEWINLKGAGEYFASSHYVFWLNWNDQISRLELRIHKTKGWRKDWMVHTFEVDYSKNQFKYEELKKF